MKIISKINWLICNFIKFYLYDRIKIIYASSNKAIQHLVVFLFLKYKSI